jgi:GT2 family glycosyltransferase
VVSQVSVGIVTFNSAAQIGRCLASVFAQSCRPVEVVVWDNASADDSAERARALGARVVSSDRNLGFAAAANELVRRTTGDYLLLLNPDAYPASDYLARLVAAAGADPSIGSVTGKLLRSEPTPGPALIDSAGHVFYRNRSALNRGENELDQGQFDEPGEVFGVCAAAALYRRAMLEDVRVGEEYFDSAFFAYLEDVDLDWRARLRGWTAYYVPAAVAIHERGHKGKRRMKQTAVLRHSLKNRYLIMLRNERVADVVRDLPAIAGMELLRAFDYALTHPGALRGYLDLVTLLPHALATRRQIQARRAAPPSALRRWVTAYPFRAKIREIFGGAPDADLRA